MSGTSEVERGPAEFAASQEMAAGTEREPVDREMLQEVREGLRGTPKTLSSRWFYDDRGSRLFEDITRLPEYYPTRTERGLLERWAPAWFERLQPEAIVELGAGSAAKTRILLEAMRAHREGGGTYVPVDVSATFLQETARRLTEDYPGLTVEPAVADITRPLELPADVPAPTLFAFLGSTIGNFESAAAVRLLRHVRQAMRPEDVFLVGVDLRPGPEKSRERLEAAYNDAGGVTAAFNRNILRVLNRRIGTDFDEGAFRHRAFYDPERGRVEMHLVARSRQDVHLPGGVVVHIAAGESIRTEISCKYDRPTVQDLLDRADLDAAEWREDPEGLYAVILAHPSPSTGS